MLAEPNLILASEPDWNSAFLPDSNSVSVPDSNSASVPDLDLASVPDLNSVSVAGLFFSARIFWLLCFLLFLFLHIYVFAKFIFGATFESLFWKSSKWGNSTGSSFSYSWKKNQFILFSPLYGLRLYACTTIDGKLFLCWISLSILLNFLIIIHGPFQFLPFFCSLQKVFIFDYPIPISHLIIFLVTFRSNCCFVFQNICVGIYGQNHVSQITVLQFFGKIFSKLALFCKVLRHNI